MKVIGDQREVEAGLLGPHGLADQVRGTELLARELVA
jgi:hypothetical protein